MGNTKFISAFLKHAAETKEERGHRHRKVDEAKAVSAIAQFASQLGSGWLAHKLMGPLLRNEKGYGSTISSKKINQKLPPPKSFSFLGKEYPLLADTMESVDRKDFKKIIEEVKPFMKEQDLNIEIITRPFSKGGDYYNPISHRVSAATKNKYITMHELGHASDFGGSIPKMLARKIPASLLGMSVAPALMFGDKIKEAIPGSVDDKVVEFIQSNPVITALAGYGLSTLYPEAKASFLPIKHLYKTKGKEEAMKAVKILGPAFGTYLLGGIPIAASAYAMKKIMAKRHKKEPLGKDLVKAAMSYKKKLFTTGAIMGGTALGLPVAYLVGTEGGRAMLDDMKEYDTRYGDPFSIGFKRKMYDKAKENPGAVIAGTTLLGAAIGGYGTMKSMEKMTLLKDLINS